MATDMHEKKQRTYLLNRIKEYLPLFSGRNRIRPDVTIGVRGICCCCEQKCNNMVQVYFPGPIKRRDRICGQCIASLMLKLNGNIVIEAQRIAQATQDAKDDIAAQETQDAEDAMYEARQVELTGVTA